MGSRNSIQQDSFIDNTDVKVFSDTEISEFSNYGVELEQIVTKPNPEIKIRGTSPLAYLKYMKQQFSIQS